jgi:hypothetical protein
LEKKLVTKTLDVRNIVAGSHILSVGGDALRLHHTRLSCEKMAS